MKTSSILLTILALAFFSSHASANDGVYFTSGSFLVPIQETEIAAKKEILTITICNDGYADVDVDYTFFNQGNTNKNILMAFEAAAPYNAYGPFNRNGRHPNISDFTAEMNGTALTHRNAIIAIHYKQGKRELDYKPLDMTQWKGYGEVPDSILPYDNLIYNEALDSLCSYRYAYYFPALFKPGENKVHHTYRYKMSYGVGRKFEIPYWLTPVTRWSNGQVDDFTLRIKSRDDLVSILLADSLFKDSEFTQKGDLSQAYHLNSTYCGSQLFAIISKNTVLEWHTTNFSPKDDINIESGDAIYQGMREYATEGKVAIEKNGNMSRYLADADGGYFVEAQDYGIVPKEGTKIELYEAKKGQGYVHLNNKTKAANVRKTPSATGKLLCVIKDNEGSMPRTYPCLGLVEEKTSSLISKYWFRINVNGQTGYVSRDLMIWDSINTF